MEIRIKIVEVDKEKFFEYQGVRFCGTTLLPLFSVQSKPMVSVFRAGKLFDWGTIANYKLFPDSKDVSVCFFGFKNVFGMNAGGREKEFIRFELEKLQDGDEIIQSGDQEIDFLRQLVISFMFTGSFHELVVLQTKYPYPENWRENISAAKAVWENKIEAIIADLHSGAIAFLEFCKNSARPHAKNHPTVFELEVAEVDGQKMFSYQGLSFDQLPMLWPFYEADRFGGSRIHIWRAGQKLNATIYVHEVGTHCAAMAFDCWVSDKDEFASLRSSWDKVSANVFSVGDKLEIKAPVEFNLTEELVCSYYGDKDPIIAPWLSVLPKEELMTGYDQESYEFYADLNWYWSQVIRSRKIEAIKDGQIKILRFSRDETS